MTKQAKKQENFHPITVEDHKALAEIHKRNNRTAVNDALGFPGGGAFETYLDELLKSDAEYENVLIDATETPIERPQKNKGNTIPAKRKGIH